MQVDNQTLITVIKETIQSSITPDYIGWTIGIGGIIVGGIAVAITIKIHRKQTAIQNEHEQFEKSLVNASRTRIREMLNYDRHNISVQLKIVDIQKGNDSEKLALAKQLMKESEPWRIDLANSIMKEADFIRPHIDSPLYNEIQGIVNHIKIFANVESLDVDFGGDSATLVNWEKIGQALVKNMINLSVKV